MAETDMSDRTVQDEAAAWVMRLEGHTPTAPERDELQAWLERSPAHASVFAQTRQAWRDLAAMRQDPEYARLLGGPTLRERIVAGWPAFARNGVLATAAGVALVGLMVAGIRYFAPFLRQGQLETHLAEVRGESLPDGSRVTLGAVSRFTYQYTAAERHVTLSGGDAFFAVTKDASRPFYVTTGDISVRVLGTQFEIRRRADEVSVAVADGVVEVSRETATSTPEVHLLHRGESLIAYHAQPVAAVRKVAAQEVGAWRMGRLVYDDVELSEVIADANRYSRDRIVIEDSDLAHMRVTTSFRTSQVDAMIETLQEALPLTAERRADGDILLRARH